MMFNFGVIALVFSLGSGTRAGTDVLDSCSTDAYWQAKNQVVTVAQLEADAGPTPSPQNLEAAVKDLESDEYKVREKAKRQIEAMGPAVLPLLRKEAESTDPEVKAAAAALVQKLGAHGKERDIRRLMAIRTLGERKEASAVPLLETLEKSNELFVAEYAARAVAQIQGKKFVATDHTPALREDVNLLADHAAVVAQAASVLNKPLSLEAIVDDTLANPNPMMAMGGPGRRKMPTKRELMQRATQQLLAVVERVGDVRLDGVTVEVGDDAGPGGGSVIILMRGEYDRSAMIDASYAAFAETHSAGQWTDEGKVKSLTQEGVGMLLASNEMAAFVMGSPEDRVAKRRAQVLAALQTGKGTLANDQQMMALLKKVDRTGPVWAAARMNDAMRTAPMFAGFDTVALTSKFAGDDLAFHFSGDGSDAAKVKASVDELNADIAASLNQLQMMAAGVKAVTPVLELFQSMKVESAGTSASLTGTFKPGVLTAAAGSMMPMLDMMDVEQEAPPATQP